MFVRLATVGPVQRISAARLWGGPLLGRGGRRWGHRGGKALYAALRSVMQEDVAQSLADCRYAITCARARRPICARHARYLGAVKTQDSWRHCPNCNHTPNAGAVIIILLGMQIIIGPRPIDIVRATLCLHSDVFDAPIFDLVSTFELVQWVTLSLGTFRTFPLFESRVHFSMKRTSV